MREHVGELFGESLSYCSGFRAGTGSAILVGERNRLVWGDSSSFTGETPDSAPESLNIGSMRDGGNVSPPSGAGGRFGECVYLRIEGGYSRVGGIQSAAAVPLVYETLYFRATGGLEIFPISGGNGGLGGVEQDAVEGIDSSIHGGWRREVAKLGLGESGEGRPVGPSEIGEGTTRSDRRGSSM